MSSYSVVYKNELYHYGILGQKWGKRNYQYEDGSLTPEGRDHYGVGPARGDGSSANVKIRTKHQKRAAANEMGKFLKKQAEKRERDDDALKNRQRTNDEFLSVSRYKQDVADRVWEKKVDREKPKEEAPQQERKEDTFEQIMNGSYKSKADSNDSKESSKSEGSKDSRSESEYKQVEPKKEGSFKDSKNSGKHYSAVKTDAENGGGKKDGAGSGKSGKLRPTDVVALGSTTKAITNNSSNLVDHFKRIAQINYAKGQKSVDLSNISEEEMRRTINRLNLERQYREAISTPMSTSGYDKAKEILGVIGDTALVIGGVAATVKTIQDLKKR